MFKPRWYKVLADLWGNKVRSLLVIASIGIGLFAVGMITSMHVILSEDMRSGYESVNPANIQISTNYFNDDLVDRIRNVEGVRQAEGIADVSLQVETGVDQWSEIKLSAIPDIKSKEISLVKLEEGVWPPAKHELVVDRYKLNELNAGVGDMVTIKLWSGKTRQMRLVGVVQDQTIGATRPGGFFMSPVQGYITDDTLDWFEQPRLMNTLLVTAENGANDPNHLDQLANRVVNEIEDSGATVVSSAVRTSNDHPNRVYIQAITSVLYLLGVLILFLSAFLITNTLSALLNQQVQQIGVMKTIGARRIQIMGVYMVLILVFSIVAFIIAAPLAAQASYIVLNLFSRQVNLELQGFRFIPFAVFLQLALALIVPQAAGFLPILHGTRISAVEAFNGLNRMKSTARKSWLDGFLSRLRKIPRPQLISLRNTFRNRVRLGLTLFTLTLGGAIFIATFNVRASLENKVERISRYFLADVNLTLARNYRISEVEQALKDVDGVGLVEGWAAVRSELVMDDGSVGESLTMLGPPANSTLVEPVLLDGRWVTAGDQNAIAVSERFLELYPDLKAGDKIRLKVDGDEVDFVVVGVFQLSGKSGGFLAYSTYEYLSKLTHTTDRASSYRIVADHPNLTLKEQKQLGQRIERQLDKRGFTIADISEGQSITDSTSDGLNALLIFLLILATLTAVVGSIGLTGTMSLNVLERVREIGVMRAIGASNRSVIGLVIIEGLIIGMISWVFGTLLAFPISSLLTNAINLSLFGAFSQFTFTPIGIVIWLGVVLALSVVASVMPARNAARLTIREVLAYE
jgi:putative ABC transport system permease protein